MTRLEENNDHNQKGSVQELQAEVEKLKKNLKRKQNRKLLNCRSCFALFILVVLGLTFLVSYVLAKSGLKEIPFFSEKYYKEPQPSYYVNVNQLSAPAKDLLGILKTDITNEFLKQKKTEDLNVALDLTDEQITYLILEQIKANESLNQKVDYLQIAVLPDYIELFLKTKNTVPMFITLRVKPFIKDGKVDLQVLSFKVGDLDLPKFAGDQLIGNIGKNLLNDTLSKFSQYGQFQTIDLYSHKISIQILIKNLKNVF